MQIEFKSASFISAGLHGALLLAALLTFSASTREAAPMPSMPVDLVSVEDFSKLAKGAKDAPKAETPKPLVEKKAEEPKPVEEVKPKVEEKKPVETVKADTSPPPAPEKKPDPIADKIKKEETKPDPEQKKVELPPKKPQPPKPQPKFDADKIAALLDKRAPQREASAGDALNQNPSLGASQGSAARLSQSEIDAMRARLRQCWNPPVGASEIANLHVVFRVLFKRDGTVAREPTLVEASASAAGPALAESAKRALLQCQPFTMLRPEHYELWKDLEVSFDPREMFGG